ncbi:Chymotrypsin inhibitor [Formica fusca]
MSISRKACGGRRPLEIVYKLSKTNTYHQSNLSCSGASEYRIASRNTNMARAVILLFLIAVATINAVPHCGVNEVFNSCGSSCPSTCQNPVPPVCTLACIPGCDCIQGYVRNGENRCIATQNC